MWFKNSLKIGLFMKTKDNKEKSQSLQNLLTLLTGCPVWEIHVSKNLMHQNSSKLVKAPLWGGGRKVLI